MVALVRRIWSRLFPAPQRVTIDDSVPDNMLVIVSRRGAEIQRLRVGDVPGKEFVLPPRHQVSFCAPVRTGFPTVSFRVSSQVNT